MGGVLSSSAPSRWRTAYASVAGTSHAATQTPCQDAGRCEVVPTGNGLEIFLAVVSDGAGSAPRSDEGSQLAVELFLSDHRALAADDPTLATFDEASVVRWLRKLRRAITKLAALGGHHTSDYACTFLAAVVAPSRAVLIQIGDGAIVTESEETGDYVFMVWPQHGEFANSTNFVTQEGFEQRLEVAVIDHPVSEVALFSDGIERLVLDFATKSVHTPALKPIFNWLAGTIPDATATGPAAALVSFLGSEQVNRRTDDDKTLVMATRVPAPQPA